jgi:protein-disulfide isomerase
VARRARAGLIALVCLLVAGGPGLAQPDPGVDALRGEIEALKKGQMEIQDRLDRIETLLRGRAAPPPFKEAVLSVDGAAVLGEADARVTVIEFSDYQCPFCRRFASGTLPQLIKDYVETGKVRYVFRDFPLESIHPAALEAAAAARCAGEQGRYWEMHDRFFARQKSLADKDWPAHAAVLGLDAQALQACVESGRHADAVAKDLKDGQAAGVRGTPSFFLGLTEPGAPTVKATKLVRGARPYDAFKQVIESLLADKPG